MHDRVTLARAMLLLAITLCTLGAYVSPLHAGPNYITLATGGVIGTYFPAGTAICRIVNLERNKLGVRCSAKSTSGAIENIRALRSGKFDFALVPSDLQYQAFRGEGAFTKRGGFENLRAVISLHAESFTVIVRANSGIETFDDLNGKSVNVGPSGSGQRRIMEHLIDAKEWETSNFRLATEINASDQIRALCDKKIDAISYLAGHPSGTLRGLAKHCPVRIIGVSEKVIEKLVSKYPYYSSETISGGMYVNNPDDVTTFGVRATLVTTENTPPRTVYAIVSAVFENLDKFRRLHPAFARLDPKEMVHRSLTAPVHKGAIWYFEKSGLLY